MTKYYFDDFSGMYSGYICPQQDQFIVEYHVVNIPSVLKVPVKNIHSIPYSSQIPGIKDTQAMLTECCAAKNLLLVPGNGFTTNPELPCQYVRACYSAATPEQMDKVHMMLAKIV